VRPIEVAGYDPPWAKLASGFRLAPVSADGAGIVSQDGGLLLTQTLRATGLDRSLPAALERWRQPRAVHSPGKIITGLAVAEPPSTLTPSPCC
jgi:hypothetical protein